MNLFLSISEIDPSYFMTVTFKSLNVALAYLFSTARFKQEMQLVLSTTLCNPMSALRSESLGAFWWLWFEASFNIHGDAKIAGLCLNRAIGQASRKILMEGFPLSLNHLVM
jgi:hypothetical protein